MGDAGEEKMKIGIYDPYLDDLGGGEKYMMTIAECLSKDHKVHLFWDKKEELDALLKRFSIDLSLVKLENNIFTKGTPLLKRLYETKKYDRIIVLSDGSIPIVSCPLLLHFQQPLTHIKPTFLGKLKLKRVKTIFCNSNFTKSFIDKEFDVQSLVLYPPISIKAKNLKKENIILSVGRFRVRDVIVKTDRGIEGVGDYKKLGILINVFKEMVDDGLKDWKLVLAVSVNDADKEKFEILKKQIEKYPVSFEINRTNKDLWEIYSKTKIYWHAAGFGENLEKHPEFAEHFGISTVEAMGAGAVPVVIGAGGQKETVKNNENGYLWNTTKELREKTLKIITDEELLKKLSKNAQKDAQRFIAQDFCKKIRQMIE